MALGEGWTHLFGLKLEDLGDKDTHDKYIAIRDSCFPLSTYFLLVHGLALYYVR
jgi:hypothetical protein